MNKRSVHKKKIVRKKHSNTRILFYAIAVFSLVIAGFFVKHSVVNSQQKVLGASSSNEIIVKYHSSAPENEKEKVRKNHKATVTTKINKINAEVLQIDEGSVDEKVKQLKNNPFVAYAEPNYTAEKFSITNDSSLSQQWGLFKINAANQNTASAWDITTGNSTVKVAILDTGIEASHPDLAGKVITNANFTTSSSPNDMDGHGTHVAGITAAATNNGNGVAGTGYNTVLLNGKVLGDNGSGYYSWIANGIIWAADQGAHVINLSLGGPTSSLLMQDAINYAWSKNVVIVAAAGNNNTASPSYPAYYPNVIAVAATDANDNRASFSNYGSWVDVAAPGTSIYSTYKTGIYASMSGTSMASPFTAGVAALVWAKGSCTTNACVREKIEQSADKIIGTGSNWVWGRINAYNAVNQTQSIAAPTDTPLPTNTPTPTNTPVPTPAKIMTVSAIELSASGSLTQRITGIVNVVNESIGTPVSSATVKATITTPSGSVTNFSGNTMSNGKVTFRLYSKEKGTYTLSITTVTKSGYSYKPTLISKSLIVQ